mgnify:CR=1 FL=1
MSNIFLVLGFRSSLLNDLFDAEPNTSGGLTGLLLSADTLLDLFPESEFFLMLYSLLPKDVLESLSVSGSASFFSAS